MRGVQEAATEGEIVCHAVAYGGYHGIFIVGVPQETRFSLEVLGQPSRHLRVAGDRIIVGEQVVYQVTGWDSDHCALIARLVEDRRE
jgi:hypothetical protein